jgi:hypothetical protein
MEKRLISFLFLLMIGMMWAHQSAYAFIGLNTNAYMQSPLPWWTRQLGSSNIAATARVKGIAHDASDNLYVAGYVNGKLDGNTSTSSMDFFVTKYDASATKLWTKQLGGLIGTATYGNAAALDSSRNIYVAGHTTASLDGNTLTGTQDFFVTKYDTSGVKIWTRQLGVASKTVNCTGVTVDTADNIYVGGYVNGGLDGNTLTGSYDLFITKYNASGTKLWTKQLGVSSKLTYAMGITSDSSNNVYIGGYTAGGLDGNTLTGTYDLFITKYDSSGTKQWTRQLGVSGKSTLGMSMAIDSTKSVYITGWTTGGLDGNTLTGSQDLFVTKYDTSGSKQWTRQLGTSSVSASPYAMASDSSDNIYITGYVNGSFDGNTISGPPGTNDFFMTKYSSLGVKSWTKELGVSGKSTGAVAITVNGANNIVVGGYTSGGLDGNTLIGLQDAFFTRYDSTPTKIGTTQIGAHNGGAQALAKGIAVDKAGSVYVGGIVNDSMDGNTLAGAYDFFLTKFDSTGAKKWTQEMGGGSLISPTSSYAVATDSSNNVYIAGGVSGAMDGNALTGSQDFYAVKYDSSGTKLFSKMMGVATKTTLAYALGVDSTDHFYVVGPTSGGLDGNTLTGTQDFFITKYDSSGTKSFTKQLGVASKSTTAVSVVLDSSDNVCVAGYTNGGLDGNTLTGTQDFFITKYDSSGTKLWTKQLGVAGQSTYGTGIAHDSSNNLYVAGYTTGGLDGNTLIGTQDFFIAKYDSAGTKIWTKQFGVTGALTSSYGISVDSFNNIFITGSTNGSLDNATLMGRTDLFLAKYNASGSRLWVRQMGASGASTLGYSVTIDPFDRVFVSGTSSSAVDGNTQVGLQDSLVLKYGGN